MALKNGTNVPPFLDPEIPIDMIFYSLFFGPPTSDDILEPFLCPWGPWVFLPPR